MDDERGTFSLALLDRFEMYFDAEKQIHSKEVGDSYNEFFFFGKRHPKVDGRDSPNARFLRQILYAVGEVNDSLKTLNDIVLLAQRPPRRTTGVSDVRFLRFCIESYLHGVYQLHQRLERQIALLRKAYRNTHDANRITAQLDAIDKKIHARLYRLVAQRGVHVHQRRFTPIEFDQLSTWELLISTGWSLGENPAVRRHFRWLYRQARTKWVGILLKQNERIRALHVNVERRLGRLLGNAGEGLQLPYKH